MRDVQLSQGSIKRRKDVALDTERVQNAERPRDMLAFIERPRCLWNKFVRALGQWTRKRERKPRIAGARQSHTRKGWDASSKRATKIRIQNKPPIYGSGRSHKIRHAPKQIFAKQRKAKKRKSTEDTRATGEKRGTTPKGESNGETKGAANPRHQVPRRRHAYSEGKGGGGGGRNGREQWPTCRQGTHYPIEEGRCFLVE